MPNSQTAAGTGTLETGTLGVMVSINPIVGLPVPFTGAYIASVLLKAGQAERSKLSGRLSSVKFVCVLSVRS